MKSRKLMIALAAVFLTITLLSACHRSTCPTFGKDQADVRTDIKA